MRDDRAYVSGLEASTERKFSHLEEPRMNSQFSDHFELAANGLLRAVASFREGGVDKFDIIDTK